MDLDVWLCYGSYVKDEWARRVASGYPETEEERKIEELMREKKLELVSDGICYAFDDSYVLAIKQSKKCSDLGQVIQADPEWRERINQFCKDVDILFKEPEWHVCAFFEE